jgi:hypothetical protein
MREGQTLLPHHCQQLTTGSGISPEVIIERGYRSIASPEGYTELKRLGFSRQQAKQTPGLLIPILGLDGKPVLYQYRPDIPRINNKGRAIKYETPTQHTMRLDFGTGQRDLVSNPAVDLWITEGAKKLDALRSHGLCGISLLGVWNWRGTNLDGGKVALADWESVALNGREVFIVFDSDVTTKPEIQRAVKRLRGFLAQRGAKPVVVHLPANGETKVGVDDFLLEHTVEDLIALATPAAKGGVPDDAVLKTLYRKTSRGLIWQKPTRDGCVAVPLTNFTAQIVADVLTDDGAEQSRQFELEAMMAGRSRRFSVSAAQFAALGWVHEHLGAQAMVYPGQSTKDHTRAAIQVLSDIIVERRIFRHSGWRRSCDGDWYYFHGGGVLGQSGQVANMEVSLPSGLERFILPDPPSGNVLKQAIGATLDLLNLAPDYISVPLWAAIWRAVLGGTDFGIHLTGPTGTGKTELATLVQQHYGAGFDARHLPGSWLSTGNSLEDLAFTAKDAILVIDDFAPGGTTADMARTHREADRVLRAQGNRAGRQRMRADGTLRPAKPPRGLILSTGEDIPRGQSLRARMVIIEVSPADVDWTRLADCQQDATNSLYAQSLADFVCWLAPRYERTRETIAHDIAALQAQAHRDGQHRRAVANVASLAVGIRHWLRFAQDRGAITTEGSDALWERCWTALFEVCTHQQRYQDASEPTQHFLRLLSAAIASGRAHLASPSGSELKTPQAYGWRPVTVGTGPYVTSDWHPQGRRIGWLDDNDVYLEPEAAFAEAQSLAVQQGEALRVSPQTLRKRLHERRLLASTGKEAEGRETLLVRRTIEGSRRDVLHLHARSLALHKQQEPGQPDQRHEVPLNGRENLTNGQPLGRSPDQRKPLEDKACHEFGQLGQVLNLLELQPPESPGMPETETRMRLGTQENLTKNLTTPQEWEEI